MPFSSQHVQPKSKPSITKYLSFLAAVAACVFAIAIPSVYYAISINATQQALSTEAAFFARSIEKIVQGNPDLWEFESVRLVELISQPSINGAEDEREIRTMAGNLVAKNDFMETRPTVSVSATFFDSGRVAGSLVVRHSIRTQIIKTAILGILGSFLGYLLYFISITYPIRKLEKTLTELHWEKDKYETTLNAVGDGVISVGRKGKVLFINRAAESLVGMDSSRAVGRRLEEVYVLRYSQENQVGEKGCILTSKTGNEYAIEEVRTSLTERESDKCGVVIAFRDITERKQAEAALLESELLFRKVFEDHVAVKMIVDPDTGNIFDANGAATVFYGWSHEQLTQMKVQEINTLSPEEVKKEMERARNNEKMDFEFRHRRADGSVRDVRVFSSKIQVNKKNLLHSIIFDITDRKEAEEKLHNTLDRLRNAINTTIQVLVSTVEARDPYTAGHQIRVADLARAISTEMGLSEDTIEGIRVAGSIHDIGKLSIPAEILSKPGKLSDMEFALIKEHAQKGYEMLKDVESPWPLAEIVYQHHERMDGSGYPRNLKGDEILLEARIMAVADVVEAMASHRPYRPGLGIDAALEEIEKNKGVFYDPETADACLRLFREKDFQFKGN